MSIIISSIGVNPSNRDASFPNLARANEDFPSQKEAVTATCQAELRAAGIPCQLYDWMADSDRTEVPSAAFGALSHWSFQRAWYYWIAKGPGLPPDIADRLHETHGQVVRVEGHCGCPSPREYRHGFAIGLYHVDSPEGLKALADAIKSVWDSTKV